MDEQMECDGVQSLFLRNDLSDADRANVFCRVIEYYKEKPSAERARLLQDLSNVQASDIAGISSRTLAKARKLEFGNKIEPPPRSIPLRRSKGGFSSVEVRRIAFEACFDQRFCEIRAWKAHAGEDSERHFECIGLVDIKTMWEALSREHGNFCSLRNFYRMMPDFFVEKKKERCVCGHCKRGRRYLDNAATLINALRRSIEEGSDLEHDFVQFEI